MRQGAETTRSSRCRAVPPVFYLPYHFDTSGAGTSPPAAQGTCNCGRSRNFTSGAPTRFHGRLGSNTPTRVSVCHTVRTCMSVMGPELNRLIDWMDTRLRSTIRPLQRLGRIQGLAAWNTADTIRLPVPPIPLLIAYYLRVEVRLDCFGLARGGPLARRAARQPV